MSVRDTYVNTGHSVIPNTHTLLWMGHKLVQPHMDYHTAVKRERAADRQEQGRIADGKQKARARCVPLFL